MKKVRKLFVVFQMKFRHIFIPFISLNIECLFLHLLADTVDMQPSCNQIVDRNGSLDNQNQFSLISGYAYANRGELYVVWARVAEKKSQIPLNVRWADTHQTRVVSKPELSVLFFLLLQDQLSVCAQPKEK